MYNMLCGLDLPCIVESVAPVNPRNRIFQSVSLVLVSPEQVNCDGFFSPTGRQDGTLSLHQSHPTRSCQTPTLKCGQLFVGFWEKRLLSIDMALYWSCRNRQLRQTGQES